MVPKVDFVFNCHYTKPYGENQVAPLILLSMIYTLVHLELS